MYIKIRAEQQEAFRIFNAIIFTCLLIQAKQYTGMCRNVEIIKYYRLMFTLGPGWRVHNMLRVRVCAAHMGGFLGQNSLNKGPFFGRSSINMGGISRNW